MHIFISGILGSGLSSLAHLCLDLGFEVSGSDISELSSDSGLSKRGIKQNLNFQTGQDPEFLKNIHTKSKIDYYIYTPALKADNPEKLQAKNLGIPSGKQNFLINIILELKSLKLIAVAGTHGKTTTTAMLVWLFKSLNIPVSYIIGSEVSFGNSGQYELDSKYLIYEADEYDKKFLDLYPEISIITSLDYDHPDTYPSETDYFDAFRQFCTQTKKFCYIYGGVSFDKLVQKNGERQREWQESVNKQLFILSLTGNWSELSRKINKYFSLPGKHNRLNAYLVLLSVFNLFYFDQEFKDSYLRYGLGYDLDKISSTKKLKTNLAQYLNDFPGTSRRFEKITEKLFSDYAHHPSEILATLELASEYIKKNCPNSKLVVVYQPHQNTRQHQIQTLYKSCFNKADKIYWLPTYLTRENPSLSVLTGQDLTKDAEYLAQTQFVDLDHSLLKNIKSDLESGALILILGAGDIDNHFRTFFSKNL